ACPTLLFGSTSGASFCHAVSSCQLNDVRYTTRLTGTYPLREEHMRRALLYVIFVGAVTLLGPATASAQVAIAGVVKDASGAVMPGVTVEASSPALIEKVRNVVTDNAGQYKIVDLSPGIYQVTFTLPGFKTS